jgi:hypothetical protein
MRLRIILGKLKGTKEVETTKIRTTVDRIVDNLADLKLLDGASDRIDFRRAGREEGEYTDAI